MKKSSQEDLIKKFRIVIDTREQLPYKFSDSISNKIPAGDYTIFYDGKTYENEIIVERKSREAELFNTVGSGRDRFERELEKLSAIRFKWVICEFNLLDIVNNQPPGILPVSAVYGSIISWHIVYGVPFIFAGNRANARAFVYKLFYNFVKYRILERQ